MQAAFTRRKQELFLALRPNNAKIPSASCKVTNFFIFFWILTEQELRILIVSHGVLNSSQVMG